MGFGYTGSLRPPRVEHTLDRFVGNILVMVDGVYVPGSIEEALFNGLVWRIPTVAFDAQQPPINSRITGLYSPCSKVYRKRKLLAIPMPRMY